MAAEEEGIRLLYEYLGMKYVPPAPRLATPVKPTTQPVAKPTQPIAPQPNRSG